MSTVREEFEIARRYTPDFGGRTLVLEAGMFALAIAATALTLSGQLPIWAGMIANTVFIYGIYTVVHEAVHANISSRRKSLRWVDTVAGMLACVPLWLFYHQHRRQHMAHHAHTNEEVDPDIYARASFMGWIALKLPVALLGYFNPVQQYRDCCRFSCTGREIVYTFLCFAAYAGALIWALVAGYSKEVLLLWFIPWWIGQSVMLTFFTWLPHHDHHETGRYRNTRVSIFPGANVLLQGQGYHLIHHMAPSVPYYRYEDVFREMRLLLVGNDVRIEGVLPDRAEEARARARVQREVMR